MVKSKKSMKIVVSKDGPYLVSGNVPLSIQIITPNKEGLSWDWKQGKKFDAKTSDYSLCRCGQSTKPFCDGTHTKIRFDGIEKELEVDVRIDRDILTDQLSLERRPRFMRICTVLRSGEEKIWSLIEENG